MVAILVINVLIILSFLQLSSVQTYLGRLLAKDIAKETGFDIKIGKVDIDWLDQVSLKSIEIIDPSSNKMISIRNLLVDYRISTIRNRERIVLDRIILSNPEVNLSLADNIPLNITTFIASLRKAYGTKKNKKPKPIIINEVAIENGNFTYNQLSKDSLVARFDYNHFAFDSINLNASHLIIVSDTFKLNIEKLTAKELSTGLPIKSLTTKYFVSNTKMKFHKLNFKIGSSTIKDSIVFEYAKMTDLNNFVNKVYIDAHFEYLKLSTQDLKYFAPYFASIHDTILFTGNIEGHIKNFNANNFHLNFGKQSNLSGSAYFEGLPDVYNTFIDLKFKNSNVHKPDLAIYIPSKSFKKYYPIESANVKGSFTGYPKDFVADAEFKTNIGIAKTDLNLKIDNDPSKSKYSGSISLIDFDLGKIGLNSSLLGKISLTGNIKGNGFTKSSADFKLESQIEMIELNHYKYTNIKTNAHFAQELFDGSIKIDDPNLQFETEGIIDLRNNRNLIKLSGDLKTANLTALKIRKDTSTISAKFKLNVKGIVLDSIVGKIDISDLKATNNENVFFTDKLELKSEIKNNNRVLVMYSDRVKIKLEGDYNFTSAYNNLKNLWSIHHLKFLNQSSDIDVFYSNYKHVPEKTTIDFEIELFNVNPLLNLFDPLLYLSKNTKIKGIFNSSNVTTLDLKLETDTLTYDHNLLVNNELSINSITNYQSKKLEVKLGISSKKQILRSGSSLDSLSINGKWKNDSIDFNFHIQQGKQKNINNIEGYLIFQNDTSLLSITNSHIQVLDQVWNFERSNLITFTKNNMFLSNMGISSGEQSILASGSISKYTKDPISILINAVQLENLNPLITNELNGVINGSASISNIFNSPLIETQFNVDSLQVDGYYFGDIVGKSNWDQVDQHFTVDFFVEKDENKLVNITGSYEPLGNQEALNLNASLQRVDLKLIEPFTKGLFSDIEGDLSGNIKITGPLFEPKLNGIGHINNASLTIDYLNAKLNAAGSWRFDSSSIALDDIKITDNNRGTGNLNAIFKHTNYKAFNMDLKANFDNLIALNTSSNNNNYYYGTAIGTGSLSITGPIDNLIITTRAKTNKGTKLYIPLSNTKNSTKQKDFISFTSFTQIEENIETGNIIEQELKIKHTTVNLDIEITPEAYAEIIFDLTAGDIIRGRGKGNISIGVDTKGEFTVLGEYEFTEGAYNFTMYNIVNKEFKINPKSKISWSGDPYLGQMDIDALYEVNTSLAPIMDTTYHDLPEVKRIYPSKVLLDLNGPLLSPDIAFDILIEDYPKSNVNIDTEVRAFLNKIHNDEQEMNRQVFSLLVFRKYSPPNSFSTGGTVGSSVSEFVSNQLSYWISQVDENLTIDFDLGNLDEDALQTFQLRVSYAFMDGKLIITRDGGFTDQNQEATLSSITGDWTVEYLISEDGRLRIKIFKKTNYDQLSSSTGSNDELVSGGFSLLFTTSFDSLKDLFNKNKDKKSKEKTTQSKPKEAIKPEDSLGTP